MSEFFRLAYQRTRARYSDEQWLTLEPRQITDAIYREMRLIDAETAGGAERLSQDPSQPEGGAGPSATGPPATGQGGARGAGADEGR